MLRDELRDTLAAFVAEFDAISGASIGGKPEDANTPHVAVGRGQFVIAELIGVPPRSGDLGAALERLARALRAAAKRWGADLLPTVHFPGHATAPGAAVIDRMRTFLQGMCESLSIDRTAVWYRGSCVVQSEPLSEIEHDRTEFIVRRALLDADKSQGTSHTSHMGDDHFAMTFYYGAVLLGFFSGPVARDFVTFRAKQVCRELGPLLEMLDDPPPAPAAIAPVAPDE